MNVIVTGGTGFLGNALVSELIRSGDTVTALVRPNSVRLSRIEKIPGVKIVEARLDEDIILPKDNYDVFYHLAWEGERDNYNSQYKNVKMTLNCLNASAKYGCKRFICTGSQAEYGETDHVITEETPVAPTTSYGAAKAAAYYLSKDLARHYNIEHIWVRVFSVYGENDNANTLYTQLSEALHNSKKYSLSTDGKHMWNFLHETDAARALRLLYAPDVSEGVYNLASKYSRPLCEYVDLMRQSIDPSAEISFGNQKSKINLNASTVKLRKAVGEFEEKTFPV